MIGPTIAGSPKVHVATTRGPLVKDITHVASYRGGLAETHSGDSETFTPDIGCTRMRAFAGMRHE